MGIRYSMIATMIVEVNATCESKSPLKGQVEVTPDSTGGQFSNPFHQLGLNWRLVMQRLMNAPAIAEQVNVLKDLRSCVLLSVTRVIV